MEFTLKDLAKNKVLICDKCGKNIKHYYNKNFALRKSDLSNGREICAYCKYEEFDDKIKVDPFYMVTKGLLVKKTDNNLAVSYWNLFDEEFTISNSGKNPYQDYFLAKEVYDRFNKLNTFEDYYEKHLACSIIGHWEGLDNYKEEMTELERSAKDKFNKSLSEEDKSIEDKIIEDFNKMISDTFEIINVSMDESLRINAMAILYEQIDNICSNKYMLDDKILDISQMTVLNDILQENETQLKDELFFNLTEHYAYLYEYTCIQFEWWKVNKDPKILNGCLNSLGKYLHLNFCNLMQTGGNYNKFINDKNIESGDSIYNFNSMVKLEEIIEEFTFFFEVFEDEISRIEMESEYRLMSKRVRSDNMNILALNKDGSLTEASIVVLLKDSIDPLYLLLTILLELQRYMEENLRKEEIYNDLIKIRKLKSKLEPGYEAILNCIYSNKIEFNYAANREIQKIKVQLNSLIQYMDKFNSRSIKKEDFLDLFLCKKSMFSQFSLDTECEGIDVLLNQFLDKIINLLKNSNTEIKFMNIDKMLKSQLNDRYNYIEGSAYESLLTAEYLYSLFIKEEHNILDIISMNKDYSCISIMYYKALEDSLNKIIYKPYANKYIKPLCKRITKKGFDSSVNLDEYFAERDEKKIKNFYFRYNKPVENLMLGNLSYFMKPSKNGKLPKYLVQYLKEIMKGTEHEIIKICENISKDLREVSGFRNVAAHGGEIVNIEGVKRDKKNVFVYKSEAYRRILFNLLESLK